MDIGFLQWLNVRDPASGKLLFRYEPEHNLVHYKRGRIEVVIELDKLCRREHKDQRRPIKRHEPERHANAPGWKKEKGTR